MSTSVVYEAPRRSSRVFMSVTVMVSGKDSRGRKFSERSKSIVINAHGGLLHLNREVDHGAMLLVTNPVTWEELECRVVFVGQLSETGQRVGIEFLSPAPHFWGVEFTRPDWTAPSALPPQN
jgi:hypothetical protein